MNLKELNESYKEYTLTEAYLTEGLRIFKESKKLYKISEKITSKLGKIGKTGDTEAITAAKKLAADIKKLGDEYKKVEDAFANNTLDRTTATAKLKALKTSNDSISGYIKSAKTKSLLGKIGIGVLVSGLAVLLGSIAMNPSLIASIGSGVKNFAAAASAKIGSFFGKKSAPEVDTAEAPLTPADRARIAKQAVPNEPEDDGSFTVRSAADIARAKRGNVEGAGFVFKETPTRKGLKKST